MTRVLAGLVLLAACVYRPAVTARQLVAAPERFADVDVVIAGQVTNPRFRMPESGDSYTSFTLADGTETVPVFGWGRLNIGMGELVEVRGTFRRSARAGADHIGDAIEVAWVRRLGGTSLDGPAGVP